MVRPPRYARFAFTSRAIDWPTIRLGYALLDGEGPDVAFEETLEIPPALATPSARVSDVSRLLLGLHLVGGMSYWKTCCPARVEIGATALDEYDAALFSEIWREGLGEFFYTNDVDPSAAPQFAPTTSPGRTDRRDRGAEAAGPVLLLWGGGKDSAVSHEILEAGGEAHDLLVIGRRHWAAMAQSASVTGRPLHVVERSLDRALFEMNRAGALNGHVPLNAYLAFAGLLVARLTGRRAVVASNEASASVGSVTWRGIDVNHQWSKGLAFERSLRAWIDRGDGGPPTYFSLLRPLTELRIAKAFATHPRHFAATTSCNRNFAQEDRGAARWCGRCAKCVFVYLVMRPWLDDEAMTTIFGCDVLADLANLPVLERLSGLSGFKPFECVGTPDEAAAALYLASRAGRRLPPAIRDLWETTIRPRVGDPEALARSALALAGEHCVPEPWRRMLEDYVATR